MNVIVKDEVAMKALGRQIGSVLRGGECIELIGDVGAGKTTLMKGLGEGLTVDEDVQSPSFTISRVYEARDGLRLEHYDFYRLADPGVMSYEIKESLEDSSSIVAVEWAETVSDVLPSDRIKITIAYLPESESRDVTITFPDEFSYVGAAI